MTNSDKGSIIYRLEKMIWRDKMQSIYEQQYIHPSSYMHTKDKELTVLADHYGKFNNFIRKHKIHKMEVLRRNLGLSYNLSHIWAAQDFRGCV